MTQPTTMLGVCDGHDVLDGHGTRSATQWGPVRGVSPGAIVSEPPADGEQDGPGTWVLALDPVTWPVGARGLVVEPGTGRRWAVIKAEHRRHGVNPGIDWVRVEARTA
ncbi:hypothetical protein ABT352_33480 [Streptosporangium sp. NPDC000563]|uniref:hypothetical protein n=1 Tax=Streptosporangium sp. NPDC000563 TaxID=3154366 RepID=UPI003320024E